MYLEEQVKISRRFQRSIRIDSDLFRKEVLEGFICPRSSAEVLYNMMRHISETGQGAFTWTGPYGGGKSSLIVALSALLAKDNDLRKDASKIFGGELSSTILKTLPVAEDGWNIIPVVGRRGNAAEQIGAALKSSGLVQRSPKGGWSTEKLISSIKRNLESHPSKPEGIILFIDEMGKTLESAAKDGFDIYLFQELAEIASRSNGRFILIGVLHQAFADYSHKLSQEMRDDWAKVQGRFLDLSINSSSDEQIDLISRAVESQTNYPETIEDLSAVVSKVVHPNSSSRASHLNTLLNDSWPLHPVVTCLLGPISRRRFGQNQRSIFGFLNSSEPFGFQEFLKGAAVGELYSPDMLWDYLRINLEPTIMASPDGHRWALASEAIERCESLVEDDLHIKLLKIIAVIDLFKERSGIVASFDILKCCLADADPDIIKGTLANLAKSSFTIYKKFLDAHAIYAGSDFDIDKAVKVELDDIEDVDFRVIKSLSNLNPILAKRHYHETGTLRWFDVDIIPLDDLIAQIRKFRKKIGTGHVGQFLLGIPTKNESSQEADAFCNEAAQLSSTGEIDWDVIVGVSEESWSILPLAKELLALDRIRNNHPELTGDPVARKEVESRLTALQSLLETEISKAFDTALWFHNDEDKVYFRPEELNSLASKLAGERFPDTPRLHNELLNRQKPSSNAIAAQNTLLRKMVLNEGEPRLGIEGYPAEGGLFSSILEITNLYQKVDESWKFHEPTASDEDRGRLAPLWTETVEYIRKKSDSTIAISEIFHLWSQPPFGVKQGLMPVLSVAFIISQRHHIAVYRDGIFRIKFDDVDVEYLAKNPNNIQLRWMELTADSKTFLSEMAHIVRELDRENTLVNLAPIDVARGLVAIFDKLPAWTKRTVNLSSNAIRIRDIFKTAQDPNKFLFDDIPRIFGTTRSSLGQDIAILTDSMRDGLIELTNAYPQMLRRMQDIMLTELQVPNSSSQSIKELCKRAKNVKGLGGDFRLEAFVSRLSTFDGGQKTFEGVVSLAANKPSRGWVDADMDRAAIELADLSQKFTRLELFTRVKGRSQKRQSMAVVVGLNGKPTPMLKEFEVLDSEKSDVNSLVERLSDVLGAKQNNNVVMAALAELSAKFMDS